MSPHSSCSPFSDSWYNWVRDIWVGSLTPPRAFFAPCAGTYIANITAGAPLLLLANRRGQGLGSGSGPSCGTCTGACHLWLLPLLNWQGSGTSPQGYSFHLPSTSPEVKTGDLKPLLPLPMSFSSLRFPYLHVLPFLLPYFCHRFLFHPPQVPVLSHPFLEGRSPPRVPQGRKAKAESPPRALVATVCMFVAFCRSFAGCETTVLPNLLP